MIKTMTLTVCSLILVFSSLSAFSSYSTFAGFDHFSEAILHTYSAYRASNGKAIAQYAEVARIHANATRKDNYRKINYNLLDEGIRCLNTAVKEGNSGNTGAAKQAAGDALFCLIQSINNPVVFHKIKDDG